VRVAVIGTGISGLVAAERLCARHELTVFEAGDHVGGHTNTIDVDEGGRRLAIDTGFIVFNQRTYPRFIELMTRLGVAWQPSDMSFSVRCEASGIEYGGSSLDQLFAQRRNALRPSFLCVVRDLQRFYREAPAVLADERPGAADVTLGDWLRERRYSRAFIDRHLVPLASAVWSARTDRLLDFPLRFLVRFFDNHGFLQLRDRPQWLVIRAGSRSYVGPLTARFADRIRLRTPVARIVRRDGGVIVSTGPGAEERFDRAVLACHSDQALRVLADATPLERELLSAFEYQRNEAVLHTDPAVMPRLRRAWSSWNYHVAEAASELPTVSYWMNRLQGLSCERDYFVTLNRSAEIDPRRVVRSFVYHHPSFSPAAVRAQARHGEIDGRHGVHFCGAYWGFGFHEDGVRSGLAAAAGLEAAAAARAPASAEPGQPERMGARP
jgi:predicted NAD/FAD-binding protein